MAPATTAAANAAAGRADVVFALGTRLQDFITGSWTVFSPETRFVSLDTARFDAVKHRALAVVGYVREASLISMPVLARGGRTRIGWHKVRPTWPIGTH
ncbi:hypothetical protein [Mesorhizobium caraganae]|uniref:hypothetical protein n=1 Tax=Mesorhizobium caraganae TaxID=483206 RepID=UPI001AEED264